MEMEPDFVRLNSTAHTPVADVDAALMTPKQTHATMERDRPPPANPHFYKKGSFVGDQLINPGLSYEEALAKVHKQTVQQAGSRAQNPLSPGTPIAYDPNIVKEGEVEKPQ